MLPMQFSFRKLLGERFASPDWYYLSVNVCLFFAVYMFSGFFSIHSIFVYTETNKYS